MGNVLDAWIRVLRSGEIDSSVIVHDAPTEFIQYPKSDARFASHSARKRRLSKSGPQLRERARESLDGGLPTSSFDPTGVFVEPFMKTKYPFTELRFVGAD